MTSCRADAQAEYGQYEANLYHYMTRCQGEITERHRIQTRANCTSYMTAAIIWVPSREWVCPPSDDWEDDRNTECDWEWSIITHTHTHTRYARCVFMSCGDFLLTVYSILSHKSKHHIKLSALLHFPKTSLSSLIYVLSSCPHKDKDFGYYHLCGDKKCRVYQAMRSSNPHLFILMWLVRKLRWE